MIFQKAYYLYYIFAGLVALPVIHVFGRVGLRKTYACLLALPMVGLSCCLFVLAFKRWPRLPSLIKKGDKNAPVA